MARWGAEMLRDVLAGVRESVQSHWDDRWTAGLGVSTVVLSLDTIGRVMGILGVLVGIVCTIDRRLCERRAAKSPARPPAGG